MTINVDVDEDEDENEYPPGAHASGGSHFLIVTISTDDTDETDGRALHLRLYCTAKKSMALVIAYALLWISRDHCIFFHLKVTF